MGQSSIPILNRSGYSMFWSSLWDSKFAFSKLSKEDIFIRKFIIHALNEKVSSRPLLLTNSIFKYLNKNDFYKFNLKLVKDTNIISFSKYLFRLNKLPNYISKIRILRFQKWLVIYLKVFTPNPLRKVIFKKKTYNNFRFFSQYYLSFLKNKTANYLF